MIRNVNPGIFWINEQLSKPLSAQFGGGIAGT